MKASRDEDWTTGSNRAAAGRQIAPAEPVAPDIEIDLSLLEESLRQTPWERMQANDDAVHWAESLRTAMRERNAKSKRTDPPAN